MSTMISPTCHHGITGHHGGDVCKNPTKPHRCHPLSTGACQPCLAPQGCTCHRFQIVFEVEVLGMILYETMKLSHKNYNINIRSNDTNWIFMNIHNVLKWHHKHIFPSTCSIPPIFPSSKQIFWSFLNMPKATRTTRSSTNSNPNGRVSGNSLERSFPHEIPVPHDKLHQALASPYGCFLKWWYPQNTPKWSFLVGKSMVVGYHHFRKPPY